MHAAKIDRIKEQKRLIIILDFSILFPTKQLYDHENSISAAHLTLQQVVTQCAFSLCVHGVLIRVWSIQNQVSDFRRVDP